jgi:hypothetical protein
MDPDEVGEDVYCSRVGAACIPSNYFSWPFTFTVLEYITDGECQLDLVASLNVDRTHA